MKGRLTVRPGAAAGGWLEAAAFLCVYWGCWVSGNKQRFTARVCLGTGESRVPKVDSRVWFQHGGRDGSQLEQEASGSGGGALGLKTYPYQECLSLGFFIYKMKMAILQLLGDPRIRMYVIVEYSTNMDSLCITWAFHQPYPETYRDA